MQSKCTLTQQCDHYLYYLYELNVILAQQGYQRILLREGKKIWV